ncbi:uncharacterized protein [Acropora muricata]|uniref:uncharacterized protein n=1 Tax=Acropora muricata TaxID=159855 RepID=UPI0010FCD933
MMATINEIEVMDVNTLSSRESSTHNSCNERIVSSISFLHIDQGINSLHAVRPCYYILPILGMWKPNNGKFEFIWTIYRIFVFIVWLACLTAIMCLDFVHYGFEKNKIHIREIMNSVCSCVVYLCPYIFTTYYLSKGQFAELVFSVQNVSHERYQKISCIAKAYTLTSLCLWGLCTAFNVVHWFPFFTKTWHYVAYTMVIVFIAGWWSTWLSVYGFVCHAHSLQIDTLVEEMKSTESTRPSILYKHSVILSSLERTQKDFGVIISLALAYHAVDLIVFSLAYFNGAFGKDYPIWQYIGTVIYDLISISVKLYPPAVVAAAAHRMVMQACRRCQAQVTPMSTDLPTEDMQVFQYLSLCEKDMGLKILGIRITVELATKIFVTIVTAMTSFVAFMIPRHK